MNKNCVSYKNGNYTVTIDLDNGTKTRTTEANEFIPSFSESCDVMITEKCNGGCKFCYVGCTPEGRHGDILNYKFLDTLHPYTEFAINGNDLSCPGLYKFMCRMRDKKIILNMTVNQVHFEENFVRIKRYVDQKLIHGLGVSLVKPTEEFIKKILQIPNVVIHVINGLVTISDLFSLSGYDLKILILGYKNTCRGKLYRFRTEERIDALQSQLEESLFSTAKIIYRDWFKVVCFDNLAIEQLHVKDHLPKKIWDKFYMGGDGDFTFYIDLVNGVFAKNSTSNIRYPITDNIDDMFKTILKEKGEFVFE